MRSRTVYSALCLIPLLASPALAQTVHRDYGQVPLSFEANAGQTDARVQFLSRGEGYGLFLTQTEAVFSLQSSADRQAVLMMSLAGANAKPAITPEHELAGKINYITSQDPAKWRRNISSYGRVRYSAVYPGIDLLYYGNQRQLEFDFIVSPGADPARIALVFDGTDAMSLNDRGDLVLDVGGQHVVQHRPVAYQKAGGTRHSVDARYVLNANRRVAITVGDYDTTLPLVIDPVLVYATLLGGGSTSTPAGIAADASGNAYIVGTTGSTHFPVTTGAYQTALIEEEQVTRNVFVTKLNSAGTAQVYSTFFGAGFVNGTGIAVDQLGQAYITGWVLDDLGIGDVIDGHIPVVHGFTHTFPENDCFGSEPDCFAGFLAKLDATGSMLLYSSYLGDEAASVAVDNAGHAYVAGFAWENAITATSGAAFTSGGNAWVMKIDTTATGAASLKYATYLGGVFVGSRTHMVFFEQDNGVAFSGKLSIAIDGSGSAYVAGTAGNGFPVTSGAFDRTFNDTPTTLVNLSPETTVFDIVALKLDPAGSAVQYATYLGGSLHDAATGIAVDSAGNAYVAGVTNSFSDDDAGLHPFPTTAGAYSADPHEVPCHSSPDCSDFGSHDSVVVKLNTAGDALIYSTYLGGHGDDVATAIAVDGSGHAYVTGYTTSADFPTTADAPDSVNNENPSNSSLVRNPPGILLDTRRQDVFVTKLSADGSSLEYSTLYGGTGFESPEAIAVDLAGNAYVTGLFSGHPAAYPLFPDYPGDVPVTTHGAFDTGGVGGSDGFVFKLGPNPNVAPTIAAESASVTVYEGQTPANTGTYSDANSVNVTLSASIGTITKTGTSSGTWSWAFDAGVSGPVTITADDGEGGTATATFDLVVDNVAPVITFVGNATAEVGVPVSYTASAHDAVVGDVTPACAPASGFIAQLGNNAIGCSATDGHNAGSTSFVVTGVDTIAPTLVVPGNMIVDATGPVGASVTYTVTASDAPNPAAPTVSCTPASGSTFAIGSKTVACTATDASGHSANGSFTVAVRSALEMLTALQQQASAAGMTKGANNLDNVLKHLTKASGNTLTPACNNLDAFIKKAGNLPPAQSSAVIDSATRLGAVIGCR